MIARSVPWTAAEIAELRRFWAARMPLSEIAARLGGRSVGAISNKARHIGLPRQGTGGKVGGDPARDETLRRLWMACAPQKHIAAATGIHVSNLWYHVARLGLPKRIGHGEGAMLESDVAKVSRATFRRLWQDRVPEPEIARRLGITQPVLRHIRDELGLSTRYRRGRGPLAAAAGPAPLPRAAETVPVAAAPSPPDLPAHPFWTPERDAVVLRTGGRYAEIAATAAALGKPSAAVVERWHRLRVA